MWKVTDVSHSVPCPKGSEGPAGAASDRVALSRVVRLVIFVPPSHPLKLGESYRNPPATLSPAETTQKEASPAGDQAEDCWAGCLSSPAQYLCSPSGSQCLPGWEVGNPMAEKHWVRPTKQYESKGVWNRKGFRRQQKQRLYIKTHHRWANMFSKGKKRGWRKLTGTPMGWLEALTLTLASHLHTKKLQLF